MGESKRKSRITSHVVPDHTCLNCGKVMDRMANSPIDDATVKPYPGAIAVCLYCHHVHAYAEDMQLRELTGEEIVEIAGHPDLVRTMKLLEGFERFKKRRMEELKNGLRANHQARSREGG